MHPKYILISDARTPRTGTFVYGMVGLHEELRHRFEKTHGYGKMHGGGWYRKDDAKRTMTLFGVGLLLLAAVVLARNVLPFRYEMALAGTVSALGMMGIYFAFRTASGQDNKKNE